MVNISDFCKKKGRSPGEHFSNARKFLTVSKLIIIKKMYPHSLGNRIGP